MSGVGVLISFSCFSNLFTVYSASGDQQSAESIVDMIIAEVNRHGFIYLEVNGPGEIYSGISPYLKGQTWWIRYFDSSVQSSSP